MREYLNMLTYTVLFAILILGGCKNKDNPSGGEKPVEPTYNLVWSDEFDGPLLYQDSWTYHLGTGSQFGLDGWGNNEQQYYTDRKENVYLENGYLILEARKERYENKEYTSGRIVTQNKHDFLYGKIEIRAQLPKTQGIWPAIWMLPTDSEYGGWPASGEIDIMELLGHQPETIYGTAHFGNSYKDKSHITGEVALPENDFSTSFHVFTLEWTPGSITWLLDGTQFHYVDRNTLSPYPWPFDKKFYVLLNIAVGGYWPGYPNETTVY